MEQKRKRKKKRQTTLLLIDYECLSREEQIRTIHEMRVRLKDIFRHHIGKEEFITPVNLFTEVFGVNPENLDIYKTTYWWSVLKKVLRGLRSDRTLFVINNGRKLYVLHSQDEANMYKRKIDKDIIAMGKSKVFADEWVRNRLWREL